MKNPSFLGSHIVQIRELKYKSGLITMQEKKSLLIINDDSEYKSFLNIIKYNKSLLNQNIILIDRRQSGNSFFKLNDNKKEKIEILTFHTSQKWFDFLISAKKVSNFILQSFEIDNLYIFYQYDPLVPILLNNSPDIKLNLIFQRPELEENIQSKYFSSILKSYIKNLTFFLVTKKVCFFGYRETIHNFLLSPKIKKNVIRMYPNKEKNLFDFAQIYINDLSNAENPVFISSCNYQLNSINYQDYLNETINFIKANEIEYISFHPREDILFKKSILDVFPTIKSFSGFKLKDYKFRPDPITISSQVCFDLLLEGYNVFFVPGYFPSTFSAPSINFLRKYLNDIKDLNNQKENI